MGQLKTRDEIEAEAQRWILSPDQVAQTMINGGRLSPDWAKLNLNVYVGTMEFPFGRMLMSHLASPNLEALHDLSQAIGIKRKWFQDKTRQDKTYPHYDICKAKKKEAIRLGVIEIDDRELIKRCYER